LLEQAIQVQEVLDPEHKEKHCDLLLTLAQSMLSAGEPLRVAETVAPQALEIAERLGDKERASQACLFALGGLGYHSAGPIFTSPEWARWAEKLDANAAPETIERAIADAMMSWTYFGLHQQQECWELRRRALSLARRLGDPAALGIAILSFMGTNAPPQLISERLGVAEEFAALSQTLARPSTKAQFLASCAVVLLSGGNRAMAERLWEELDAYADRVGDPYVRTWQISAEALRLYLEGELERTVELAEQFASQAGALGVEVFGQLISAVVAIGPLVNLGRFEEAMALWPRVQFAISADAGSAWLLASAGRPEEARREVQRIMAAREIGPDEDWTDTTTLALLLEASVIAGDADAAAILSRRLAPLEEWYEARSTVARLLGQAALMLGNAEAARTHFTTALDVAQRIGARGEIALTRLQLAELLLEHYADERVDALEHLDFAIAEFREMKMQPSLEQAMRLKMQAQGIDTISPQTSIDAVAASVYVDKPDLRPHAAPDGTVTILFTDIEGSTAMTERLGDQRWLELLRAHNAIVRQQVTAHEGFEVKSEGDGFMLAFQSARKALGCAAEIQRAFAQRNESADEPIRVRIGLHTGEAIKEADDFFGKNVILAARIAGQAQGGEILVSSLLKELTESGGDIAFGEGREVELKGLAGPHRVFEVGWEKPTSRSAH
jgi:class 3 adenylate cyclase